MLRKLIIILVTVCLISIAFTACDEPKTADVPYVLSTIPADGSGDVAVNAIISITFSISMNSATAEGAFSTSPVLSGLFTWNGNSMTFRPAGNLLPGQLYEVTISSSARSGEDVRMESDYLFNFTTAQGTPGNSRTFTNTRAGIFIFSDQFNSNLTDAQWRFAAENYVGCQKMTLSSVRKLRSYNSGFIVLHYRLAHGAGNHEIIKGENWVRYWGDVNGHENWFIHMTRGNSGSGRVHNAAWNWDYMDPSGAIEGAGSDGWKEYFTTATIEEMRATEYDGTFADSCGQPFSLSSWPGWLSGTNPRTTWLPHVNTYMQHVMTEYKNAEENFYFIPNAGALVTSWDDVTDFSIADGVMVEEFSEWGGGALQGEYSDWTLQMNRILDLTALDKIIIMQTYPSANETKKRMFALGCYLLVKGKYSYINMPADAETELFWWPEYDVNLGAYISAPPANIGSLRTADGVFRRQYENGWVYANPTGNSITINLGETLRRVVPSGGGYVNGNGAKPGSLSYQSLTSLTLASAEAAILLDN